ncbi:hypothetical protein [Cellvibrio sp. pealriver]|uniref:hypothetical protein n=1 Tax=Cellvibrio sp. pealriver TaxID=1622269 RepID=UPI00066FD2EC|nr:hypothetical protein [Cellvibrio sp. pealriver]
MKNEDKTTPLEKLGYGLKYTLAIIVAILAICALCFIFISITTYFAPPLQPMFDQERLGQLGDFLGGTLNPIFGFATVCLLLWSVFIQRKELSLTRDELKKSAGALENQFKLATEEYNRKQLDDLLKRKKEEDVRLRNLKFKPFGISIKINENDTIHYTFSDIGSLINSQSVGKTTFEKFTPLIIENMMKETTKSHELIDRRNIFLSFKENTMNLIAIEIELLRITNIQPIKDQLRHDAIQKARDLQKIHLLDHNDLREISLTVGKVHSEKKHIISSC